MAGRTVWTTHNPQWYLSDLLTPRLPLACTSKGLNTLSNAQRHSATLQRTTPGSGSSIKRDVVGDG